MNEVKVFRLAAQAQHRGDRARTIPARTDALDLGHKASAQRAAQVFDAAARLHVGIGREKVENSDHARQTFTT